MPSKGIKGVVIISAGFKETGPAGKQLEEALVAKLHEYGMTCVGPNCLGSCKHRSEGPLRALALPETLPVRGDIGFVSRPELSVAVF